MLRSNSIGTKSEADPEGKSKGWPSITSRADGGDGLSMPMAETGSPGVPVTDNGKDTSDAVGSPPDEVSKPKDNQGRSPERVIKSPEVGAVTTTALQGLLRDCEGRQIGGCHALAEFAKKIVSARTSRDGGWAEWMESQIVTDLVASSAENHFSEVSAACSEKGCVFYLAAYSNLDLPDHGSDNWREQFETWLSKRPWAEELADNAGRVEEGQGSHSFARSRIIGSATHPHTIWYVVGRRP